MLFVEIVKKLVSKIPQLKVAIVGDGELRKQVEQKILDLNLTENITLWGFQKNPYGLVKNTKVVCMPSVWEGFGLAAVEQKPHLEVVKPQTTSVMEPPKKSGHLSLDDFF